MATTGKKYIDFNKATSISDDDLILISQKINDIDTNTLATVKQIKDACAGGGGSSNTNIEIVENLPDEKNNNTIYFLIKDTITSTITSNTIKVSPNMRVEVINNQ